MHQVTIETPNQKDRNAITHWFLLPGGGFTGIYIYIYVHLYQDTHIYIYINIDIYIQSVLYMYTDIRISAKPNAIQLCM